MKGNTILLLLITVLLLGALYLSYTNFQQIQVLRQENTDLWFKIDSVQQICLQSKKQTTKTPPKTQTFGDVLLDYFIKIGEEEANERAKQKVLVSSKYRLENRYVISAVKDPELLGEQVGMVVLDILVNRSGDVKSATLQSATGITNEDVIEACKKAALKTNFNFDSDSHDKLSGTITYIFSEK